MKRPQCISGLFTLLFVSACAEPDPCVGVRDLVASPAGLVLTAEEHGVGWGREACFACHPLASLHAVDCTAGAAVDGAAVNALIDPNDTSTCVPCHGENGVGAWQELGEPASGDSGAPTGAP